MTRTLRVQTGETKASDIGCEPTKLSTGVRDPPGRFHGSSGAFAAGFCDQPLVRGLLDRQQPCPTHS